LFVTQMIKLRNEMKTSFGEATVCNVFHKKECDIHLSPGLLKV